MVGECRLLDFSVHSKEITEDCSSAENSVTYKVVIRDPYCIFNVMKGDMNDQIKKIK
jgi:hypothetical protein